MLHTTATQRTQHLPHPQLVPGAWEQMDVVTACDPPISLTHSMCYNPLRRVGVFFFGWALLSLPPRAEQWALLPHHVFVLKDKVTVFSK